MTSAGAASLVGTLRLAGKRRNRQSSEARSREFEVGVLWVVLFLLAALAPGQLLSDVERDRPISIEDARPTPYRAFSGSADWTHNLGRNRYSDYGPGFSLSFGAARGLEVGASSRYVTRPDRNAARGISSGDLGFHALWGVATETSSRPALGLRAGVEFPTGLESKGTNLELTGLATRSFDSLRLHANLRWKRLGDSLPTERRDRLEAIAGLDTLIGPRDLTDWLLLADVSVRSSRLLEGKETVELELGTRARIGTRTIFFLGAGSEIAGDRDRVHLRLRAGFTHLY